MTVVVAVVDAAGRQVRLAAQLAAAFERAGLELALRTQRALVAETSVELDRRGRPTVLPDRPLLWLSPGDSGWPDSSDGRFLSFETLTAARSIAMLTSSPVLNRPGPTSQCGAFPMRPALSARRARGIAVDPAVRTECFTSTRPGPATSETEVFDYGSLRSSYGWASAGRGPYRYRARVPGTALVKVVVVGDRPISATGVPDAVLDGSVRIVALFDLDVAISWWLVGPDDVTPTLARIDCWLWDGTFTGDPRGIDGFAQAVGAWLANRMPAATTAGT